MDKEQIIAAFIEWLDSRVIAEAVIEVLEKQKAEVTVDNAKRIWLDFLETELPEGLSNSLAALVEQGFVKAESLPF